MARLSHAPAAGLAALVVLSTAFRTVIGVRVPTSWILPDEIVYSELAKSIAAGHRPSVRGVPVFGWGEVYPTLIAPAWALIDDPVRAYHAALAISALVMSLAAVPAYGLARLFVSRRSAFLVSAATVLVPSMAYAGVVMTENAFYPVFLLSVLLIARAVQQPTAARQTLALLGLVLVAFTRIQGLALVAAYLCAAGIYALTGPREELRRYVRRFVPTVVLLLVAPLAPLAASVAQGDGPFGWLGSRSDTFAAFHAREIPEWFLYLTSDLILYVAIAPAAATAIVLARGLSRKASAPMRLFAAVTLPTLVAMLASVSLVSASLDVDQTENLNERYVFYVVPLLFVGFALWVREGLPRPRPWALVVVAASLVCTLALPIDRLDYNASFQSVGLLPWLRLSLEPVALAAVVGTFTLVFGVLWLTCRGDRIGRLCLLVALWMAFVGTVTVQTTHTHAVDMARSFRGMPATWVDDAVAGDLEVPVVWDERLARRDLPDPFAFSVMLAELFNDHIGRVYRLGPPTYYESFLPTVPAARAADGAIVDPDGRPVHARYVLVTCRTPVAGRVVDQSPRGVLQLVEVDGIVRSSDALPCRREAP